MFLQPYANYHMPHTLHCLEIHPEIVLVLVEEVCTLSNVSVVCVYFLYFNKGKF